VDRRKIIMAALGGVVVEAVVGVRYPAPVAVFCLASTVPLLGAGFVVARRRNRRPPAAFVVDEHDRSFRTPVHVIGLLLGLACLQLTGMGLALVQQTWVGLVDAALFGGLLSTMWRALWRGYGLILRPDGIEAGKAAGALVIPWEALASDQPGRGARWWEIKLAYARPELVVSTGFTPVRDVVTFEGVDPDFVIKAIATYAAEPGRRYAIGTVAELERLHEGMPAQLRGIREIVEPAPIRITVRRAVAGLTFLTGGGAVAAVPGWLHFVGFPLGWIGTRYLYLAVAGMRATRRARPSGTGQSSTPSGAPVVEKLP
jgi:hypothetical protein